jgi:alanine-glyoxylate transaminase/serine-glyoxylate transaminase/serine-pyruvate transaminase
LVDAVTSLGCIPVDVDRHGVDALYSCSQKGLSCTPGLSPVSFSARAVERVRARKSPPASFYLDLELVARYWHGDHRYHHTASSNLFCALHEAARLVLQEGLAARYERHRKVARALWAGLEALGLELLVPEEHRLPQLTAVRIPAGVDDLAVRKALLAEYGIEIGGGLGPLAGKLWRIGLMGSGATPRNVLLALSALGSALAAHGVRPRREPVEAARAVLLG